MTPLLDWNMLIRYYYLRTFWDRGGWFSFQTFVTCTLFAPDQVKEDLLRTEVIVQLMSWKTKRSLAFLGRNHGMPMQLANFTTLILSANQSSAIFCIKKTRFLLRVKASPAPYTSIYTGKCIYLVIYLSPQFITSIFLIFYL